jgi:site-specific recombinase XerD
MRRQLILEHKTSKTTEIYTHVSENNFKNFKNPIDDFEI